jgi:hypothetical protein
LLFAGQAIVPPEEMSMNGDGRSSGLRTGLCKLACRLALCATAVLAAGCSGSTGQVTAQNTQMTGGSCTMAAQCYPGIDAGALAGQVTCLTQLSGGYCTHTCATTADCCTVAGECPGDIHEVCAPIENQMQKYCFLSCAATDLPPAADGGTQAAETFCKTRAGATFTCRSTGGGSANMQFCGP